MVSSAALYGNFVIDGQFALLTAFGAASLLLAVQGFYVLYRVRAACLLQLGAASVKASSPRSDDFLRVLFRPFLSQAAAVLWIVASPIAVVLGALFYSVVSPLFLGGLRSVQISLSPRPRPGSVGFHEILIRSFLGVAVFLNCRRANGAAEIRDGSDSNMPLTARGTREVSSETGRFGGGARYDFHVSFVPENRNYAIGVL